MGYILNESCEFICSFSGSVIEAKDSSNTIARDSRKKLLTVNAKCSVKVPGICPILTARNEGTPTPCQFGQTAWSNPSSKVKCGNYPVLTDKSVMKCVNGGVIKVSSCKHINKLGGALANTGSGKRVESVSANTYNEETADADAENAAFDLHNTEIEKNNIYVMKCISNTEEYIKISGDISKIKMPVIKSEMQHIPNEKIDMQITDEGGLEIPDAVCCGGIMFVSQAVKDAVDSKNKLCKLGEGGFEQ